MSQAGVETGDHSETYQYLIVHNPGPKSMQVTENSKAKVLKTHRKAPKERPKALQLYVQMGKEEEQWA